MSSELATGGPVARNDDPTGGRTGAGDTDRGADGPVEVPGDDVLAQLVRDLADAVVVADARGTITFWNEAATRIFGWPAAEALGQSLDLIIPPRLRARHWEGYDRVMVTGETSYGDRLLEVPAEHRDGRTLSIAFTVSLLTVEGEKEPRGIAAVIRDDTDRWQERRRMTKELAELRRGVESAGG